MNIGKLGEYGEARRVHDSRSLSKLRIARCFGNAMDSLPSAPEETLGRDPQFGRVRTEPTLAESEFPRRALRGTSQQLVQERTFNRSENVRPVAHSLVSELRGDLQAWDWFR